MTSESQTTGTVPPIPPWLYWTFMALAAAIPTLLVSGVVPSPWNAVLAALNAAFAVLTGTSRPAAAAERVALAAQRKSDRPGGPPRGIGPGGIVGCLALGALLTGGCLSLAPVSGGLEVGGLEPSSEAEAGLSPECVELDNAYIALQVVGTVLSGVGGMGGAALAIWPDPTRDELIGIGIATAGSGLLGSGLLLGAGMVAQRFVDRCTGGP